MQTDKVKLSRLLLTQKPRRLAFAADRERQAASVSAVGDEMYAEFDVFPDRGPADSLRCMFQSEGIPRYMEPQALSGAMETQFVVFVLKKLEHRALDRVTAAAFGR